MPTRSSFRIGVALALAFFAKQTYAIAQSPLPDEVGQFEKVRPGMADALDQPSTADGMQLEEALRPVASYFQAGGSGDGLANEKPKYPTIAVTGLAQIDGIWFAQDDANQAIVGDAQDVAEFRRARLGVKGVLADNVSYMMEYDFAIAGRPNFTDVFVDVADLPAVGHFRVGQWRQPFSLESLTSVRDLVFMERSLPFALIPFRQIGAGFYDAALDEQATWAVSGYRFPTDVFGNAFGDSGYGMSTRETLLLWANG